MNRRFAAVLLAAAALAPTACAPPSAEELVRDVMQVRNNYDAKLQSWIQREDGTLYLDVLVVNNNETSLRTLTVMVEQLDADNNVLSARRVPIDVAELTAGLGQSVGVTVPAAAAMVEGVRLYVEPAPPREAWAEFPEFDAVRPRI